MKHFALASAVHLGLCKNNGIWGCFQKIQFFHPNYSCFSC